MKQDQILVTRGKWEREATQANGFDEGFFFLTPMIAFEFSIRSRGFLIAWLFWAGNWGYEREVQTQPLDRREIISRASCSCKRMFLKPNEHYATCNLIRTDKR